MFPLGNFTSLVLARLLLVTRFVPKLVTFVTLLFYHIFYRLSSRYIRILVRIPRLHTDYTTFSVVLQQIRVIPRFSLLCACISYPDYVQFD